MLKKRVLIAAAISTLIISTGHAKPGKGKGGSAVISYDIDQHTCAVTVSSTKDISNIVIKDDHGNTVKKWDNLSGKSFSNFGHYAAVLTDGTLHVKSGNNGVRGLGPDIGAQFRHDLLDCLKPDCRYEDLISTWVPPGSPNFQGEDYCSYSDENQLVQLFDCTSSSCNPGFIGEIGLNILDRGRDCLLLGGNVQIGIDVCPDYQGNGYLGAEEALACAALMNCSEYGQQSN